MKFRIILTIGVVCSLFVSCSSHSAPSIADISLEEISSPIEKTSGKLVEVRYRRLLKEDVLKAQAAAVNSTASLPKELLLSGNRNEMAVRGAVWLGNITYAAIKSSDGKIEAQELTFESDRGGREECFLQVIYKEHGPLSPGDRGYLEEYLDTGTMRFVPEAHVNRNGVDPNTIPVALNSRAKHRKSQRKRRPRPTPPPENNPYRQQEEPANPDPQIAESQSGKKNKRNTPTMPVLPPHDDLQNDQAIHVAPRSYTVYNENNTNVIRYKPKKKSPKLPDPRVRIIAL